MSRQDNKPSLSSILFGVGAGILAAGAAAYGVKKLVECSQNEEPMKEKTFDDEDSDCGSRNEGASYMPREQEQTLHTQLTHYYRSYVQVPNKEMKLAQKVVDDVKKMFLDYMRHHVSDIPVVDLLDTGSATEGLKVIRADEFDVMIQLGLDQDQWHIEHADEAPGYWQITNTSVGIPSEWTRLCSGNSLQPSLIISRFQSIIQKMINIPCKYGIRPSVHGPAITLNVTYTDDMGNLKRLDIDFVPAVCLDNTWVVAKPHPEALRMVNTLLWRQSFSLLEFKKIDKYNYKTASCHRMCLMIMKAIRLNHTAQLKPLSSYVFKTILMHLLDEEEDWRDQAVPERILDFLSALQDYLRDGVLPNYFCHGMNLLQDVPQITRENIRQFILRSMTKRGVASLLKTDY